MNQQLQLIFIGELGVIVHSLIKAKSLSSDFKVANEQFSFIRDYVRADIFGVILAVIAPPIWMLLFGEVAAKYSAINEWAKWSFFGVGLTGSYLLQLLDNRSKKYIRGVIDKKTNIADDKTNDG